MRELGDCFTLTSGCAVISPSLPSFISEGRVTVSKATFPRFSKEPAWLERLSLTSRSRLFDESRHSSLRFRVKRRLRCADEGNDSRPLPGCCHHGHFP